MSRVWKPGDVAMWRHGNADARHVLATPNGYYWRSARGDVIVYEGDELRPLVVIDPEDREQVEALWAKWTVQRDRYSRDNLSKPADWMQAALRELADPTPPRPPEPQGLGAVVEDAEGVRWVRYDVNHPRPWWHYTSQPIDSREAYADVTAVRVLSEGVTP